MIRKKILFLVGSNKFSGAENVVCTIINNIGENFDCLYCCPEGPIKEQLEKRKIKYKLIKKINYNNIKKVLDEYKPDIIHANDYRATLISAMFYRKYRIISHIHVSNPLFNRNSIYSKVFNIIFKRVEKIIWVSESALNKYYYKDNIINKSIVLYNIIDTNYISEMLKEYDVNKIYDLIFLGRLSEQKNPEKLIEIIELLKRKQENIKVAIVGDGEKQKIIKSMIDIKHLNKNIDLYGFQANPYPILNNSKILIMTSKWEGMPMVALEAQSFGKVIISTPVDGMKKIIQNDVNGFLSEENSEIVDKIIEYLEEEKYNKMSKNVKSNFTKINNEKKYFEKIHNIYIDRK